MYHRLNLEKKPYHAQTYSVSAENKHANGCAILVTDFRLPVAGACISILLRIFGHPEFFARYQVHGNR
jgi:hypothetical protein